VGIARVGLDRRRGSRQDADVEVAVMGGRKTGAELNRVGAEPDVSAYCPSCGARGDWQKCKLICTNPRCSVRIILACVD
jgi:hypothetical protein